MDMKRKKAIIPESISKHIEEEYKKDKEFRKAYDEEVLKLKIAYRIIQLRKERHLTQEELAEKVGTTQQNISRLEDFKNTQVTLHTLTKLAVALNARLTVDLIPQ